MPKKPNKNTAPQTSPDDTHGHTPLHYLRSRHEFDRDDPIGDYNNTKGDLSLDIGLLKRNLEVVAETNESLQISKVANTLVDVIEVASKISGPVDIAASLVSLARDMVDDGILLRNSAEITYFVSEMLLDVAFSVSHGKTMDRLLKYLPEDSADTFNASIGIYGLDKMIDARVDAGRSPFLDRETYRLKSLFDKDDAGRIILGDGTSEDIRLNLKADLSQSPAAAAWLEKMIEEYGIEMDAAALGNKLTGVESVPSSDGEQEWVANTRFLLGTMGEDQFHPGLVDTLSRSTAFGSEKHGLMAGLAGDDTMTAPEDAEAGLNLMLGGWGHDTITGGAGSDYIDGGAGDDVIDAGGGDDMIFVSGGNDEIDGGSGRDRLDFKGAGSGLIMIGGAIEVGNSRIEARNIEHFRADEGDHLDHFVSHAGGQAFEGLGGDDTFLISHQGATALGGAGDDVFRIEAGAGGEMHGGEGFDVATILSHEGIHIELRGSDPVQEGSLRFFDIERLVAGDGMDRVYAADGFGNLESFDGKGGIDSIDFTGSDAGLELVMQAGWRSPAAHAGKLTDIATGRTLEIRDVEKVSGTDANDHFQLGDHWMEVHLGAGDDYGVLGRGKSAIYGGEGNDILKGQNFGRTLNKWGEGRDILDGGAGDDMIYGARYWEYLSGGDGNDIIHAQRGDIVDAGAGHDVVLIPWTTTKGLIDVTLGDGNDQLVANARSGIVRPGAGNDTIKFSYDGAKVSYEDLGHGIRATLYGENMDIIELVEGDDETRDYITKSLTLEATDFSDHIYLNTSRRTDVDAGAGDDTIIVRSGWGVVNGGDGDDVIDTTAMPASRGKPAIYGGAGDDLIRLGNSGQKVVAGDGNDEIQMNGWGVKDRIFGGEGSDLIWARATENWTSLSGGEDADVFVFTQYNRLGGLGGDIHDFDATEDILFLANLPTDYTVTQIGAHTRVSVFNEHVDLFNTEAEEVAAAIRTGSRDEARILWNNLTVQDEFAFI